MLYTNVVSAKSARTHASFAKRMVSKTPTIKSYFNRRSLLFLFVGEVNYNSLPPIPNPISLFAPRSPRIFPAGSYHFWPRSYPWFHPILISHSFFHYRLLLHILNPIYSLSFSQPLPSTSFSSYLWLVLSDLSHHTRPPSRFHCLDIRFYILIF